MYAKNNCIFKGLVGEIASEKETYPCIKTTNARGVRIIRKGTQSKYKEQNYSISANTRISSGNMELIYLNDVVVKNGILQNDIQIDSNWIYSQHALDEYAKRGLIYITQDNYIRRIVNDERIKMMKDLLTRVGNDDKALSDFKYDINLNNGGWGTNEDANNELHNLLNQQYIFDFSKPTRLIGKLVQSVYDKEAIVLDFFSGSATTAHAVMQLNAEDGGHRKFIMVQLPEKTDEKSEAFKAGYKNICEIGKERIRRAGKKIKAQLMAEGKETRDIAEKKAQGNAVAVSKAYWIDSPEYKSANKQMASDLDTGFRVLKLDSTNMKDVYYNPAEITIDTIMGTVDNIKEDRTPEDLLFQVMLDLGVLLSSKIEKSTIGGKTVFNVEDSYLIACFDDNVTDEVITAIAKQKPYYFVMRDSSMANDSVATNFEQIFAAYSPDTVRKVL